MQSKIRWSLFAISSWLLISCATPPNVFVFEHLEARLTTDPKTGHTMLTPSPACMRAVKEMECGHGVSIVSGDEIFVGEAEKFRFNGKPWSQLRSESVYLPAEESYAPLAKYIINSCKQNNCDEQVNRFKVKLDSLNGIPGSVKNR